MKRLLILFIYSCLSLSLYSQAEGWSPYMKPGIVHKQLAPYVGAWKVRMSVWTAAEATPESFDLDAAIENALGGRFFEIKLFGTLMGMKYEGREQIGFDNLSETFSHISSSTFGTAFFVLQGKWNDVTKVATLSGETINPEDRKKIGLREIIKFIGKDQIVFEQYETREGLKEFMSMELVFDRKKAY